MDLPRSFTIRETSHRIHNPFMATRPVTPGLLSWRREPPDQATVAGCYGIDQDEWLPLPELIAAFGQLGCDTAPARHVRYQREYLGWGVFVLMNR